MEFYTLLPQKISWVVLVMDVIMDFEKAHETDIFSLCKNEFQKHFKRA